MKELTIKLNVENINEIVERVKQDIGFEEPLPYTEDKDEAKKQIKLMRPEFEALKHSDGSFKSIQPYMFAADELMREHDKGVTGIVQFNDCMIVFSSYPDRKPIIAVVGDGTITRIAADIFDK